jgi:8-oxo-dGTP pyrophosphatase MutT (NUDIX family)
LLLVSNDSQNFYWTPGGKLEDQETPLQALIRELREELNVEVTQALPYINYLSTKEEDGIPRQVYAFLTQYSGSIKIQSEITKSVWYSTFQHNDNVIKIQAGVKIHLLPKLINDQLI